MTKKYCKNCKYRKPRGLFESLFSWHTWFGYCYQSKTKPKKERHKFSSIQVDVEEETEEIVDDTFKAEKNANGDCSDYQRVWWKFWAYKYKEIDRAYD